MLCAVINLQCSYQSIMQKHKQKVCQEGCSLFFILSACSIPGSHYTSAIKLCFRLISCIYLLCSTSSLLWMHYGFLSKESDLQTLGLVIWSTWNHSRGENKPLSKLPGVNTPWTAKPFSSNILNSVWMDRDTLEMLERGKERRTFCNVWTFIWVTLVHGLSNIWHDNTEHTDTQCRHQKTLYRVQTESSGYMISIISAFI